MKLNCMKPTGITLAALFLIVLVMNCTHSSNTSKQVYIVSNTLFQSFEGTKVLKKKVEAKEGYFRSVLDSLKLEITLCQNSNDAKLKIKQQNLEQNYKKFYNQMMQYSDEYIVSEEGKIWTQLNQYVSEYGKENDYQYILGANGNGSLMYADSTLNITPQVIDYVNKKYSGK